MAENANPKRGQFKWFTTITTRWMDNDAYGHVNNVQYYSFFDTAVNLHLIRHGGLDIKTSTTIGLVVETKCQFFQSLEYPEQVDAGIRVSRIGTSSVTYEIGLFKEGNDDPAAFGHFVHVYVDRASQKPVPIPEQARASMEQISL